MTIKRPDAARTATRSDDPREPAAARGPSTSARAARKSTAKPAPGKPVSGARAKTGPRASEARGAPAAGRAPATNAQRSTQAATVPTGGGATFDEASRDLDAQLDRLLDEAQRPTPVAADTRVGEPLPAAEENNPGEVPGEAEAHADLPTPEITRDELPTEEDLERSRAASSPAFVAPSTARALEPNDRDDASYARVDEAPAPSAPSPRASERLSSANVGGAAAGGTARELLSSEFYQRKWGRIAVRGRSEEVDDFGFDPAYDQKARAILELLYTRYFRVETTGIERVPSTGRVLLVANHSGTLPLDGVMIKTAVKLEHPAPRDVRWLTEDFIYHMPFLGSIMNRLGAVRACQENAERLLEKEHLCAVFPEGVKGIGKLFSERYRLQRFGRGGFIKLSLRTGTPLVPVAVVGAEETNPLLFKIEYLSKALGLPYVPVTPTFPALGPLGLLPAPTKWQIHFGEPIDISAHGPDAADDDLLVGKLAERVRTTIQGMLDRAVGARKSVFFG